MLDLIARLEAATGPNRQIDELIFELVNGRKRNISTFEQYDPSEPLPRYTSSIDAALTLVPGYHKWVLGHQFASVWQEDGRLFDAEKIWLRNRTPSLALCIAALKARTAADEKTGGKDHCFRIVQGGATVAATYSESFAWAFREIGRYAFQYQQEGPISIEYKGPGDKKYRKSLPATVPSNVRGGE